MLFQDSTLTLSVSVVAAVALPVALILVLVICLPCFNFFKKKPGGFSNINDSTNSANTGQGHVNTTFSLDIDDTNIDSPNSATVSIEPLPDVTSKLKLPSCSLRPRIGCMEKAKQDASLKLIAAHHPFPRNQIVFLKELGTGWFGKVIESDAEKITTGVPRSKVVVKMLKDDANKDEQQLFIDEVTPFRELEHSNIVRLLGQCTEINPMLMIMESAAFGNLKQYLRSHRHQQAALIQKNRLIQFALDASCGLACLHTHDYLHRDLAARNCLVMGDHTLKIGDYGIAEELFKEDYMTSGSELLPIRWMAPEALKQENGTWSSHNFSKESDIWSLGVVLWEIAMLGERPYDMLTDEAVMQGVILDKDIHLPEPDVGLPNKDRLYEVMRFCWMEHSQRIKVDEIHKLLQQIASKTPEEGASKDAITVFEQKWEHLMPNQRHPSVDSIDDRLGSVSSGDSILLGEDLSPPISLEILAAPEVKPLPQVPPRASRKKVSAPDISIPNANETFEAPAPTPKKKKEEQVVLPQIKVSADETNQKTTQVQKPQPPLQQEETKTPGETKPAHGSEADFTEFTSYDVVAQNSGESPAVSQVIPDVFASPELAVGSPPGTESSGGSAVEDPFQLDAIQAGAGDALSKVQAAVEQDSFVLHTPDRPQPKARKTSTPIGKVDASPSSSSSLSAGDSSSGTFLTAGTSSPANLTDAYATASDSTLVTDTTKTDVNISSDVSVFDDQHSTTGDSSMSFEILDTTAIPSVFSDFDTHTEATQSTHVSNPFSASTANAQNPFTDGNNMPRNDDIFGDFTNGSLMNENSIVASTDPSAPSPSAELTLSGDADASSQQNDLFSFISESPITASQTQGNDTSSGFEIPSSENKPAAQEEDPFVSFGTDLSSLSSASGPPAAGTTEQEQEFPSLASQFSSLNSLSTSSAPTPQAGTQSNPFALDSSAAPMASTAVQEQPGLGDFSFDMLSSQPDVASTAPVTGVEGLAAKEGAASESSQQAAGLFVDLSFSNPPSENNMANDQFTGLSWNTSPDSGNQSSTQQSLTDLFGLGDITPTSPVSNTAVLDSKESSNVPEPSSASADFDLLSGFSSTPASSANTSLDLFGGEGGLLQEFAGSTMPTASASTNKESQDDVLVANSSGGASKLPEASLLDFSALESSTTSTSVSTGDGANAETELPKDASGDSSLINF